MEVKKADVTHLAQFAKDGKVIIEILKGEAQKFLDPIKPKEKVALEINGNLDTVFEFLKKRAQLFKPDSCNIAISTEAAIIIFTGNDQQDDKEHITKVIGKAEETEDFQSLPLEISSTPMELARSLRVRKHLFKNHEQFQKIFAELNSFKAEVNKNIEKLDDRSGNATDMVTQKVIHNLSNKFTLEMQAIKGAEPIEFEVEIDIDSHSLECTLIAPELNATLNYQVEEMIGAELNKVIEVKNSELANVNSTEVAIKDWCFVYNY